MLLRTVAFALFMMASSPADVVVVSIPAKGSVNLVLTPSGKADMERSGTVSQVHIEVDKLQPAQKLAAAMNAYVVWAISPEGVFENLGELGIIGDKGRLDATTRFDQFGILITAEPHFMVDRPNSIVAFRNQAPKSDNIRRVSVSVEVGSYDYSRLQPVTDAVPGLVAQARAALQVATAAQADRYAESDFRVARVDLGTMEDMLGRSAPLDLVFPIASESIRLFQRSFIGAREHMASAALESARSDAALLKQDAQQLQDRMQQLMKEQATVLEQVRQLNTDLSSSVRERQRLGIDRDAALIRVQGLERDIADLRRRQDEQQNTPMLRLGAEYFDIAAGPAGTMTPIGIDAVTKIEATVGFWTSPLRIACPANAVEILKRYLSASGVPENRVVIVADR